MNMRYAIALIFLGAVSSVRVHAGCEPSLSELLTATFDNGSFVLSVAWQAIGSSYYVALGGGNPPSGAEVRVLQFDPNAQTLSELPSATFDNGATVRSVAWLTTGTNYYVATGGGNPLSGAEVRVLQFDPNAQTLSELPSATFDSGATVFSVAWLTTGTNYYVVMGGDDLSPGPEVRVLQFNPNTQTLSELSTATFDNGASVNSVAWQAIGSSYYVALGGGNPPLSGAEVRVLQFDPNAQTLSELSTATFDNGASVNSVAWQAIGSSYYVALGGGNSPSGADVRVLQFDPNAQTLSALSTATFDNGVFVYSVAWQAIGSRYYVVMGGSDLPSGPEVRVLQFNPNAQTLSELLSATFDNGADIYSVAWQAIDSSYYVATGGNLASGPEVRVLLFEPCPPTPSPMPAPTGPASPLAIALVSKYNSRV